MMTEISYSGYRFPTSLAVGAEAPSLLAGLIVDAGGNRMTPAHATKKAKRYRYYWRRFWLGITCKHRKGCASRQAAMERAPRAIPRVRSFESSASSNANSPASRNTTNAKRVDGRSAAREDRGCPRMGTPVKVVAPQSEQVLPVHVPDWGVSEMLETAAPTAPRSRKALIIEKTGS
jgi:hypothetical protein